MSERSSLSSYHRELMLSLAYLGGLTYALTLRLLPCYSARTLQRDLSDLRELGDVEKHAIYKPGPKGRPVKLYDVWTLTDKGHAYISAKANDQYPLKPAKLRHKRVMRHDLLVVETIITLVELARKDELSGLYVQCEMRLNPTERRPIPDAVVIMQFGGGFTQTDIVPWTKDPATEDEARSRIVIEADNQTEALSVIAGKAIAYQAAFCNPEWRAWWTEQFGPLPLICWVVADQDNRQSAVERLDAIDRVWDSKWATGSWFGATQTSMERGTWIVHTAEKKGWYHILSLRRTRNSIAENRQPALPANPSQHTSYSNASGIASSAEVAAPRAAGSGPVVRRDSLPMGKGGYTSESPVKNIRPSPNATTSIERPVHAAGAPVHLSSTSYTVAPSSASTAIERQVSASYETYRRSPIRIETSGHRANTDTSITRIYRPMHAQPSSMFGWEPPFWLTDLATTIMYIPVIVIWCIVYGIAYGGERLIQVTIVQPVRRFKHWFIDEGRYATLLAYALASVVLTPIGVVGYIILSSWLGSITFSHYQSMPTPITVEVFSSEAPAEFQPADTAFPTTQPRTIAPALPHTAVPTTCGSAYVISDALNVRATPGGAIQGKVFRGQEVILLCGSQDVSGTEWVYVRREAYTGWVSRRYLDDRHR